MLTKLRRFQKIHNIIIQKQLRMKMVQKYLKKDIYLQKKSQWNNNILEEHQKIVSKKFQKIYKKKNDKEIPTEISKERYISL